jgi:hypothetical protein
MELLEILFLGESLPMEYQLRNQKESKTYSKQDTKKGHKNL